MKRSSRGCAEDGRQVSRHIWTSTKRTGSVRETSQTKEKRRCEGVGIRVHIVFSAEGEGGGAVPPAKRPSLPAVSHPTPAGRGTCMRGSSLDTCMSLCNDIDLVSGLLHGIVRVLQSNSRLHDIFGTEI